MHMRMRMRVVFVCLFGSCARTCMRMFSFLFFLSLFPKAFSNFYVDNDPAACLDFLSKAKLARKSMATGLLPQLWTDAQYAKKAAELGRELSVLERLHVRQQHPVPPNINFAGAT